MILYEQSPNYFYDEDHKKWSLFKINNGYWRLEDLKKDKRTDHSSFTGAIDWLRSKIGDVTVHRRPKKAMSDREAILRLASENPAFGKALVAEINKEADRWQGPMPKGWTDKSRKKFWDTLTSAAPKHKVTECIKRMNKHMGGKFWTIPGNFHGNV